MSIEKIKQEILINSLCRDKAFGPHAYDIFDKIVNVNRDALNSLANVGSFKPWRNEVKSNDRELKLIKHAENDKILREILLSLLNKLKKRKGEMKN